VEKCLGIRADVVVHAHRALGIEDTEGHPIQVEVDAAVTRVWNRVEVHRVSSLLRGMGIHLQDTGCAAVCQQEEAFIIINALQGTQNSYALFRP
jgi:hypothetical protein